MKLEKIMARIKKGQNGSFRSMVMERPLKTKKAYADEVLTKRTETVVRLGVDYDNIKNVKMKRENGELPEKNAGLQWGEWESFPYIVKHKDKKYLRCATSKGNTPITTYYRNGKKVSFEEIENMLLASEKTSKEKDVFSVDIENIIALQ